MDEQLVTDLQGKRKSTQEVIERLESARAGFESVPAPDPAELLDGRPRGLRSMAALHTISMIEIVRVERNLEVLAEAVLVLDRAIELAEAGRDAEAHELIAGFRLLMRQLSSPLHPPCDGDRPV